MRIRIGVVVAALALGLTGCALPDGDPTEPPASAETPRPTPSIEVDPVAEIVLSLDSLEVLDGNGAATIAVPFTTWDPDLVDLFTVELGEPDVSEYPGDFHYPPATIYAWAGLRISNTHGDDGEGLIGTVDIGLEDGLTARTAGGATFDTTAAELDAAAIITPEQFTFEGVDWTTYLIEGERLDVDPCTVESVPAIQIDFDRTHDRVHTISSPSKTCRL